LELIEVLIPHPGHPDLNLGFANSDGSCTDFESQIANLKFKISNHERQIEKRDDELAISALEFQISNLK